MVRIASEVFTKMEVILQDGTEVTLKPLVIGKLRRFMKRWEDIATVANDDEGYTIFIDCAGIAIEDNFRGGKIERLKGGKDDLPDDADKDTPIPILSNEYRDYLEDTLEMDTIYRIMEICGGIKLDDPKLLETAAMLAELTTESNGETSI